MIVSKMLDTLQSPPQKVISPNQKNIFVHVTQQKCIFRYLISIEKCEKNVQVLWQITIYGNILSLHVVLCSV